jgi:hypothetical protein
MIFNFLLWYTGLKSFVVVQLATANKHLAFLE